MLAGSVGARHGIANISSLEGAAHGMYDVKLDFSLRDRRGPVSDFRISVFHTFRVIDLQEACSLELMHTDAYYRSQFIITVGYGPMFRPMEPQGSFRGC